MGFFDFITTTGGKHIYGEKLDRLLHEISALSPSEREYVKAVFGRFQAEGISKEEAEQAIHELFENASDDISHEEAEKIKQKILAYFV